MGLGGPFASDPSLAEVSDLALYSFRPPCVLLGGKWGRPLVLLTGARTSCVAACLVLIVHFIDIVELLCLFL